MIVNLCGAGSSGTTFLAAMLDRHPQIACGDELYLFNKPLLYRDFARLRRLRPLFRRLGLSASPLHPDRTLFHNLARYGLNADHVWHWVAKAADINDLTTRFHRHIERLTGKTVWVEKTPSNSRTARVFAERFPHAKLIHLVRDPRDQALSRMSRGSNLETAAWIWLTAVAAIQPLRGQPCLLEIRYEDLVGDFAGQMARLCAFLGLDFDAAWFDGDDHASRGLGRSCGHTSWQLRPSACPSMASVGKYQHTDAPWGSLLGARLSEGSAFVLGTPPYAMHELMAEYGYAFETAEIAPNGGQLFHPAALGNPLQRIGYRWLDGSRPVVSILV